MPKPRNWTGDYGKEWWMLGAGKPRYVTCGRCREPFWTNGRVAYHCPDCRPIKKRERDRNRMRIKREVDRKYDGYAAADAVTLWNLHEAAWEARAEWLAHKVGWRDLVDGKYGTRADLELPVVPPWLISTLLQMALMDGQKDGLCKVRVTHFGPAITEVP
ncbi:MAG: hypothetical protein ACRDP6_09575 [Actinoallomurus sp.]